METAVWSVETHSLPFRPFIFTHKCSLPRGSAHGSGSRSGLSCTSIAALAGTALGYPVFVLCHGDSAVLDLEVHPLRLLQQFIEDVNVGVGQLLALLLGLGGSWVGEHASFPSSSLPGQALQHCLA